MIIKDPRRHEQFRRSFQSNLCVCLDIGVATTNTQQSGVAVQDIALPLLHRADELCKTKTRIPFSSFGKPAARHQSAAGFRRSTTTANWKASVREQALIETYNETRK
jgi:hypothetical protein